MSSSIEQSIEVNVPVSTAYNQWTQFEDFPEFIKGIKNIKQHNDTTLTWNVNVAGVNKGFTAIITEQEPDQRIAWKSQDAPKHAGVITFHKLTDNSCKLMVQIDWEPETVTEKVGAFVNIDTVQVKSALNDFKKFIENRGTSTGAHRKEH